MRRYLSGALWIAITAVFGMAGCSESPLPPLAAIKAPVAEQPQPSEAAPATLAAVAVESQTNEPDRAAAATPETADAAVRVVIQGLQEGQVDALWDALPASYQRDLNELVRLSASRLNPEAWRWFLQIVGKAAKAARLHKVDVASNRGSTDENGEAERETRRFQTLATALERISSSGPGLLKCLQTADLGDVLRTDGRTLLLLLSPLIDLLGDGTAKSLRELLQVSVTLAESAVDSAVLKIGDSDSDGTKLEFVRVEGKWVPQWLAERWAGAITTAKKAVCQVLPSETASDNFGWTFQALAAIEFSIDAWAWQTENPGADPDAMLSEIRPLSNFFMLLGYLVGGPPTIECDFHQKTKQTLEGKQNVTLVYCYASKELRWDYEWVDFDLAKHVAYHLNAKKIKVVDPDRVYAWLDKHKDWPKASEIGATFKVDYVVHIDLKDYSLTEPNVNNLYRGRAECIVSVVKMDENKKDGTVIYTTPIKSMFPRNGPVDQSAMPYIDFKKRHLSALSYEIGVLFFSPETGDDIPYGRIQQ